MGNKIQEIDLKKNIPLLLSYLAMYVHQKGGAIKLKNTSEYNNRLIKLGVLLDREEDSVTITCSEIKPQNN